MSGLAKALLVALQRNIPLAAPTLANFSNAKECPKGTWQCLLGNLAERSSKNQTEIRVMAEQRWLQEYSIEEPKAIPDVWGKRGSFALVGTLLNFVLKPSASLAAEMEMQRRAHNAVASDVQRRSAFDGQH